MNVPTNNITVPGYTISDAALTLAAVDPCYCCTERTSAFGINGKKLYSGDDLIRLSQQKTELLQKKHELR
jgi:NADH-quinone oxidoreductase subunit D